MAQLEAQIPTRSYRRGVGNGMVNKDGGNVALLPALPAKPTLADFIKLRLQSNAEHCLQSARLARMKNMDEDIVFACLVHDLSLSLMRRRTRLLERADVRTLCVGEGHLRHPPPRHAAVLSRQGTGYEYPELYRTMFGSDYVLPAYQQAEYEWVRKHRWYMAARLITVNDLYSFEPGVKVSVDDFTDVIGRHFKQPKEGLGFDGSPVAHIWRTAANPDAPL